MLRKTYLLLGATLVGALTLPLSAAEIWGGLSSLVGNSAPPQDIALCSYTGASPQATPGMLVSDAGTAAADSGTITVDPCCPPMGRGVFWGAPMGQGSLLGSPYGQVGDQAAAQQGLYGPQPLFSGAGIGRETATPASVWLWVAPGYSDVTAWGAGDSSWAIAEGIIAGYRLTDGLGIYSSVTFIHDEETTTFLTSVGLQKFGNPAGAGLLQRASAWMFWDAAVDTLDGNQSHFQQLRFNLGVVGPAGGEAGVSFSVSLDEPAGYYLTPVGGATFLSTGGSVVGPYVRYPIGIFDFTAMLGFSGVSDEAVLGGGVEARLTENSSIFLDGKIAGAEGDSPSSLLVGYKLGFGRADTVRY